MADTSTLRDAFLKAARVLAQDNSVNGVPLLNTPDDYQQVFDQAMRQFDRDRPNRRIVHLTATAGGSSEFILAGAGAVFTDPADAWVDGVSDLLAVWSPYLRADTDGVALDPDGYRILYEPNGVIILQLIDQTVSVGDITRFEYTRPHQVDNVDADTVGGVISIRQADIEPFNLLLSSMILLLASTRAVQNMGTTGLPNDIIDRRTQSDLYAKRAKDLYTKYEAAVGIVTVDAPVAAAAAVKDLPVSTSYPGGYLWLRNRRWNG